MKWGIEVRYRTGNSFHSEDTSSMVELEWEDLQIAKFNLQRIKKHHLFHQQYEDWRLNDDKRLELLKEIANGDNAWFVSEPKLYAVTKEKFGRVSKMAIEESDIERYKKKGKVVEYIPDDYVALHYMNFVTDKHVPCRQHCFWVGHFERLYGAKVIAVHPVGPTDNEMEFSVW